MLIQRAEPRQEKQNAPNLYDREELSGIPFFFPQVNALLRRSGMTWRKTRLLSQLSRVSPTMLFLGLGPREVPFMNAPMRLVVMRYSPRSKALIEISATCAGVWGLSASSSFLVNSGLILFSFSKPGLEIPMGKIVWILTSAAGALLRCR